MVRDSRWTGRMALLAALAGLVTCFGGAAAVSGQAFPLALELDGTRITLGNQAVFVVRTTEARALAAAAFGFEVRDRDGVPAIAFASLDSYELLGGAPEDTIDATFDAVAQQIAVEIVSPAASVNAVFGPLAVFRFTLDPAVALDDRFEIWMHPDTALVDAFAAPVVTTVGRADFRIVEEEPGQGLGALGGEAWAGAQLILGAVTERPFAIGGGVIELFYDPALFEGPPVVVLDSRYGTSQIDAIDETVPGRVLVTFSSPSDDLNLALHGAFFNVVLQTLSTIPVGTLSAVILGPATTLLDPDGVAIPLETDSEELEFVDPELVAAAGFEAGVGLTEWWWVVQ